MTLTGLGYDVHRFAAGRPLVLGGVEIPHDRGLDGHSDADVLSHAIGERDIGHHFPNTDASIRGISSLEILARARELVAARGGCLVNIDATVIAEEPKIAPHAAAMREKLSAALGLPPARIGLKATTNEGLGAVGRGEGIASMAVASVAMP